MKNTLKIYGLTLLLLMSCVYVFAQDAQGVSKKEVSEAAINEEYQKVLSSIKEKYTRGIIPLEELNKERDSAIFNLVSRYPNSSVSLIIVDRYIYPTPKTTDFVEPLFNMFSSDLKQSAKGKRIASIIENINNTRIGKFAPDFEQNNTENKSIKLSDYRGKYVLLDFWASWCHPCRDENPYLLAAYKQFKDKKFTIVSVSLDTDKAEWIKAIEEDKLIWPQLSDLMGGNNAAAALYGISSIPRNFLIDPDGKIIAKDLRGAELSKTLENIIQ
jgi:peroxiredoxin